jgi:glyoxylase-like metal-dependent hydrolase (beta-lactamase superfamily II)
MARSRRRLAVRLALLLLVLLVGAVAFVATQLPSSGPSRVEAGPGVVGVSAGGAYAWVVRTPRGAVLVDVGMDEGVEPLLAELRAMGVPPERVEHVLLTHGHADHWGAHARFPHATFHVGPGEAALLRGERRPRALMPRLFTALAAPPAPPARLEELRGGETLTLDGEAFEVHHVPGHTPGSVMFLHRDVLFTGDSLLRDGEDAVGVLSGFISDDPAQNRASLRPLLSRPFTQAADGHSGLTTDARRKLARLLGEPVPAP